MRLVHAADLHLDSPLSTLSRLGDDAVAQTLRLATRRALENLVQLVVDEQAPVLLLAGDVYDGNWHDYATGRFFVQQMSRLHDEGVRVFMVAGNHDAESEITRSLRLPPNVTVLATDRAQTAVVDDLGLAVHGQGFATRAVLHNLAASYPEATPGLLNLGLLHTSVEGTEGHAPYAPCRLSDLTALGYEYFALGHVHQQRTLATGPHTVAYSGNLQGRHPRETGAKGALLVDVDAGSEAGVELRPLDVARWARLEVDVTGCGDLDEVLDAVEATIRSDAQSAGERVLVARVELQGRSAAAAELTDPERLREELLSITSRYGVALEKVRVRVTPPRTADPEEKQLLASVAAAARRVADEPEVLGAWLKDLDREVGRPLRESGLLDLRDAETLRGLGAEAASALEALLEGGAR